ncbi:NAD-glutamate dehydrogenase [Treponema sp.]
MKSLNEIAKKSRLSLEDLVKIEEYILDSGYMGADKVRQELEWFMVDLGIDPYYFKTTKPIEIAQNLIALSASEMIMLQGGKDFSTQLINEQEEKAVYIIEEKIEKNAEIVERIENRYPNFRLESYPTAKSRLGTQLRFYVVTNPNFKKIDAKASFENSACEALLKNAIPETIARYKKAWQYMNDTETPYVYVTDKEETKETRIMVGVHEKDSQRVLRIFSQLAAKYDLEIRRKYREPFRDGKRISSFYVPALEEKRREDLIRDLNVTMILPDNPVSSLFFSGPFGPEKAMYAVSGAAFTHHFFSMVTDDYRILQRVLKDQPEARGIVANLKLHLVKDTYSTARIAQTVLNAPSLVASLYEDFEARVRGSDSAEKQEQREAEINQIFERDIARTKDREILRCFLVFNKAIIRTNFLNTEKSCAAFRLEPGILDPDDYSELPYGLFFLVGREFQGFHVRFRDIARGGIRIVRSRTIDQYSHNIDTIFTESYNLALTQQKKNKDIPEGGAKGAILLNLENQGDAERAFKNYVDGLLDLMITKDSKNTVLTKEILFLGPDEGSAGLMDWAALHARKRGYPYWKSFSTGKSPEIGGVPHDLYGMTTLGIHEYVLCTLEKLGLDESSQSKIQTGGPDGDLGSNEILISKDKTRSVVDGSGVLFDPEGIDRKELIKLARARIMVENFDTTKLSKAGFFVSVKAKNQKLPDGYIIVNGEEFRNEFHLSKYATADFFVPCGGRPGAINIGNWKRLLNENGNPKFKYIVEGANLFITEEARFRLEENGLILFKDSSTNKGGVTSSSLEVLASLALSDEEYDEHMRVKNEVLPTFRKVYIEETTERIKANARSEFKVMWDEHQATGTSLTSISNLVSHKINQITDAVRESHFVENAELSQKILKQYMPETLVSLLGMEKIRSRVPKNYQNAIIATKLAMDFVYSYGIKANEVDFAICS